MAVEQVDVEPVQVKKRAIDCTPRFHGIWCTVGGSRPFVNAFETRKWADDGSGKIWFMLESFNFYDAMADDLIEVVELEPGQYVNQERLLKEDAEFRAKRPISAAEAERIMAL